MATFYDWLEQLSADSNMMQSFGNSFSELTSEQQDKAFKWLKMAYISGFESAGGSYQEDAEDAPEKTEIHDAEPINKDFSNYSYILKQRTKRSLPRRRVLVR